MVNKALEPGVTWDKNNNHYMVSVVFDGERIKLISFPESLVELADECAREARQAKSLIELEEVRMKFIQLRSEKTGRRFTRGLKPLSGGSGVVEPPSVPTVADGIDGRETLVSGVRALTGREIVLGLLSDLLDKQERFEAASVECKAAYVRLREALPPGIRRLMSVEDIVEALIAEQRGGVDDNV